MSDLAVLITAISGLITAIGFIISTLVNNRNIKVVATKVDEVHTEVKTANGLSLAQLGDNDETRRIDKIPKGKQTAGEKIHIKEVPKPKDV